MDVDARECTEDPENTFLEYTHTTHTQHNTHTHTHTHPFKGPFSGTTRVSRYQIGKTSLDFTGARDSEWQRHQLGRMQVCTLLRTGNHSNTPPPSFLQPFLMLNQQRQSTEGKYFLRIGGRKILGVFVGGRTLETLIHLRRW